MGEVARHLLPYERYMTKEQYITHALAVVNVLVGQILRETNRTAEDPDHVLCHDYVRTIAAEIHDYTYHALELDTGCMQIPTIEEARRVIFSRFPEHLDQADDLIERAVQDFRSKGSDE